VLDGGGVPERVILARRAGPLVGRVAGVSRSPRVPFLNQDPPPGSGEIVSKRPVSVNDQGLQAPQTCKPWVHVRRLATGALRIFAGPGGPG
jgi:hypothetical protein